MKKSNIKNIIITSSLFALFILFTILICLIDTQLIGANNSKIGLASLNQGIYNSIKPNEIWDKIGDVFMLLSLAFIGFLAILGIIQCIKRKSLLKVDKEIINAGIIAGLVIFFYVIFEIIIINYRPTLINEELEASYPSTHTLIVLVSMSLSMFFANKYFNKKLYKICIWSFASLAMIFTAISRLLAGMHWFTDILGAVLLSASLVMLYYTLINFKKNNSNTLPNENNINEEK